MARAKPAPPDLREVVCAHTRLTPVPGLPEISLHMAHSGSALSRVCEALPYWAYPWSGGAALARYVLDHPDSVAGRTVLDLGAGSGLVAIAAAKAGAAHVTAAEIDPHGAAAIAVNAAANGVSVTVVEADLLNGPPPKADIVLAGDTFYGPDLAARVTPFLDRCIAAGAIVLVGDPGRAHLPLTRLRRVAEYQVTEFAAPEPRTRAAVYAYSGSPS